MYIEETTQVHNKNIGVIAIGTLDRELKELTSSKSSSFASLIHAYAYRADKVPESLTKKHSVVEVLCKLNQKACKKAGLDEIAPTWHSLAKLSRELSSAKS